MRTLSRRFMNVLLALVLLLSPFASSGIAYADDHHDHGMPSAWGNLSGNILNGGFAASYNGDDYYTVAIEQNSLYRNGTKISDDNCSFINVIGGHIYYIASIEDHMGIVKCGVNGKNKVVLFEEEAYISNLMVGDNGVLYFLVNGERIISYCEDDDASEIVHSGEGMTSFAFLASGDIVYVHTTKFELHGDRTNALTIVTQGKEIRIAENVIAYDVKGNSAYYACLSTDGLVKYDANSGSSDILLPEYTLDRFLLHEDMIYIVDSETHFLYGFSEGSDVYQSKIDVAIRTINRAGKWYAFPYVDNDTAGVGILENDIVLFATEGWFWPASMKHITYGHKDLDYYYDLGFHHYGIDVSNGYSRGTPVYATKSGTVVSRHTSCTHETSGYNCKCGDFGNYLYVDHKDGTFVIYGHMQFNSVTGANEIVQGQQIGNIGESGYAYGAHLHFELCTNVWSHSATSINCNPSNQGFTRGDGYSVAFSDPSGVHYQDNTRPTCTSPVINQLSYDGGKQITITAGNSESVKGIVYTLDGSAPSSTGSYVTVPFTFTVSKSTDVKAIAIRDGYNASAVTQRSITVDKLRAPEIHAELDAEGMLVTIPASAGATVYYTLTGNQPNANSLRYTGGFRVTNNVTVKAIAIQGGYANSDVAEKQIVATVPSAPTISLMTEPIIAVGDVVYVAWNKVESAFGYQVSLYYEGSEVSTLDSGETFASFILHNAGSYEIAVRAKNFLGESSESYPPVQVEAKAPSMVLFKDWDDSVISYAYVDYGTVPVYPGHPLREYHRIKGWSVPEGTLIYEHTIIYAGYTPETYTVRFMDIGGASQLASERVQYPNAAPIPTNYNLDVGHVFAGWHIEPGSAGTDLWAVNGNMTVVATQVWEHADLPVILRVEEAFRVEDGDSYKLNVGLTTIDDRVTKGRLIVTLKTSEGKMVASQTADFYVKDGTLGTEQTEFVTINYKEKATVLEVVAVGIDDQGNTGGAYSELVSSPITAEKDWQKWSDWSETYPTNNPDHIQSMVQERRRIAETKETTTTVGMEGWTLYNVVYTEGSWSTWSTTQPANFEGRIIESKAIPATYRTQYLYDGFMGAGTFHFCDWAGQQFYGVPFSYISTGWLDNPIGSTWLGYQSCSHCGRSIDSCFNYGGRAYFYYTTRQLQTGGGYSEYRYRDTSATYSFYKYGDWSDWTDRDAQPTVIQSLSLLKPMTAAEIRAASLPVPQVAVETRTVYQFRNELSLGDPAAGTEEPATTLYITEGTVKGLTYDFEGRLATILVYKRTNTDPTAEQLQYVGQTIIGEGNTYKFSFMPKNEPSVLTGDFIVSLALESATRVIDIDIKPAPKNEFVVTFEDSEGNVITKQTVMESESAVVPEAPYKPGHTFTHWNDYTTNVYSDLTITAKYLPNKYVVVKMNGADSSVDMVADYVYGDKIGTLRQPSAEGKTFLGWYALQGNTKTLVSEETQVFDNMLLVAEWKTQEYTVTFVDHNLGDEQTVLDIQHVPHGSSAQLPSSYPATNRVFAGWSTDVMWWKVTEDLIVKPILLYEQTVEAPMISQEHDYDDVVNIIFFESSTSNATIFYNVEDLSDSGGLSILDLAIQEEAVDMPVGLTHIYSADNPIRITGDVRVTMMAWVEGMNPSETITVDIPYVEPVYGNDAGRDTNMKALTAVGGDGYPGETVATQIYLSSTEGIASFQLGLTYDTAILSRVSSPLDIGILEQSDANLVTISVPSISISDDEPAEPIHISTMYFKIAPTAAEGYYSVGFTPIAKNAAGETIDIRGDMTFIRVMQSKQTLSLEGLDIADKAFNNAAHAGYKGQVKFMLNGNPVSPINPALTVLYSGRNATEYSSDVPPTAVGDYSVTVALASDDTYFASWTKEFRIYEATGEKTLELQDGWEIVTIETNAVLELGMLTYTHNTITVAENAPAFFAIVKIRSGLNTAYFEIVSGGGVPLGLYEQSTFD